MIGLSGQYAAVDGYLTARENLAMIGRLAGLDRAPVKRRVEELLELFDLSAAADRTARTYSGGMRRRLDVAASLVARPAVLFLDEPTTGLDPRGRLGLWRLLGELTSAGTSVLLTTQYLEEADRLADTIIVIDRGHVIAGLGSAPPTVDVEAGVVVVPVADGPSILPDIAARLAANGLRLSDLALRRPTLDDVFLSLTGQPAAGPSTPVTAVPRSA